MQNYDPMIQLAAEAWAALDDYERVSMVMEYHREAGIRFLNCTVPRKRVRNRMTVAGCGMN